MMAYALTSNRISFLNLRKKSFRTFALILVVAILSFALFGGTVLSFSFRNGLRSVEARLGADLIVVPLGHGKQQESILLTGEPSYFYFNKEIVQKLQEVEGISKLSTQFYLISLSTGCCSLPVQIVGFDPATDFSIQPWIQETLGGNLENGAVIVGSDIMIEDNKHIKFFDKEYPVAAKLDKTGTGLDQSVFATMETLKDLYSGAKEKGFNFLEDTDPDTFISSVLIKVREGYNIDQVITNIRRKTDGVQIVRTQNLITGISKSLGNIITFFNVFALVLLGVTLVILTVVFSASANERKKEFAIMRILGATRKKLAAVLIWESLYISVSGGAIGTILAAIFVFPFNVFIGDSIGLPYIQPSLLWIIAILLGTLLVAFSLGPIASAYSAVKVSRSQTYLTLRDGE
ncbi:MAG: FtsX-like permease family protein [Clostridiaceae bacterium]|nr:FtsX-like permease family protein [Clostridiaceae bacterium]